LDARIGGWDSMYYKKKAVIFLTFCLFLIFCAESAISGNTESFFSPEISFLAVLAIVAIIIAVITAGGIKYVTPENVLSTEVRKTLYEYIDEYPGSHLREIARELDLKPSNAAWHLRKLEQTNLVRSRAIGGKKVFYLVEGGINARREAVAESILRNNNARDIMLYLKNNSGKHLLEIAHALKLNHHTVKWHIKKMYMAELVEGDTSNSTYPVYYATDIGIQAVQNLSVQSKKTGKAS